MYDEIGDYFKEKKLPNFRFKQFEDAIFKNYVSSFDEITVFPKDLREELKNKFLLSDMILVESHKSGETIKFLFKTKDENFVESVLMLHRDGRRTVCVSCQVFCAVGCTFCATGANQFKRNLKVSEIVEQVLFVSRYLKHQNEKVTNIVFMGMGEPFLCYDNIIDGIKVFNSERYFNIGARHIVVSTSGVVPKIYEYAKFPFQTRLAVSLHAPNDKLRTELMPINKRYPLKELMEACDNFTNLTNKRISYEYVLIKDVNDGEEMAYELAELMKRRLSHVNLLIYNPHEFSDYKKPEKDKVLRFRDILLQEGVEVSIRKSMGDDISGACGQLSGKVVEVREEAQYF